MFEKFKGSAIHNLVITGVKENDEIEGIFLGEDILKSADIYEGEEIIITRIGADSWGNRIRTIAFKSNKDGDAIISGSLKKFLKIGEMTCVIAEVYNSDEKMNEYRENKYPIFDLGFDPKTNKDNLCGALDLQYFSFTRKNVDFKDDETVKAIHGRTGLLRSFAKSMVCGLVVNHTHPDCLQGSAELPASVMEKAGLERYKSVSVYNVSIGGIADTYAVPMPEGTVMTTGAMASFAKIGESVNVVSYILSEVSPVIDIVKTDGVKMYND